MLARASQLLPLARAGREVSMARPSSPRTTQPLCIALVAVAPRGSSPGRRPDLADTPSAPLRLSSPVPRHGRSLHGRTAAADENHHGHSHPLAPRLCPRAPRRRPRPPHRTTPNRRATPPQQAPPPVQAQPPRPTLLTRLAPPLPLAPPPRLAPPPSCAPRCPSRCCPAPKMAAAAR